MGLSRMSSTAMNHLIDIGYFPIHVNLDLLKLNVYTEFSNEALLATENLLSFSCDPDTEVGIYWIVKMFCDEYTGL